MERLLNVPTLKREEHRYQPASSQLLISRTTALSRSDLHRQLSHEGSLLNEKGALRGLNERFAGFIEKVHHLESQNRAVQKEIEEIRVKAKTSACLEKQYESELQELRRQVHEMAMQKHRIVLEQQHLEDEFYTHRKKWEAEIRGKTEAEESISVLKSYMDSTKLIRQDMERKAKALTDEIEFLKKNHKAEITEMLEIQEPLVSAGGGRFGRSELTAALKNIRTQLEGCPICPESHNEQQLSSQLAKLTKVAEADREALVSSKAQIRQYRSQLWDKRVELDSVGGMREALEKQIYDLEQRHAAEIHRYQDTTRELENELKNTKHDVSNHVQEYYDLLNVKMALDAEIYSYRQLLEGEESRYSTVSGVHISVPYVYRQSPIYTLPMVTRLGGVTRKAEPQYKFVEEIITETTREDIEISDTGSDDEEVAGEGAKNTSEDHSEKKETQESPSEKQSECHAEHKAECKGLIENEKQAPKKLDNSMVLNGANWDSEPAQSTVNAPEYTKEQDMDSKTQESDKETNLAAYKDVNEEVAEMGEQDKAKRLDKENNKQLKTTEQKSNQQLNDPDLPCLKYPDLRQKPTEEITTNVEGKIQLTVMAKDASSGKTVTCEIQSVKQDMYTAADTGQETPPKKVNEEAKSVENSNAEISYSKKADDSNSSTKEVRCEFKAKTKAEDVQKVGLQKSKETAKSEEQSEKKTASKSEAATETIKPETEENHKEKEG